MKVYMIHQNYVCGSSNMDTVFTDVDVASKYSDITQYMEKTKV